MAEKMNSRDIQQQSDARSQLLFDFANDGLIMLVLDGYIVDINRTGYERLGYRSDSVARAACRVPTRSCMGGRG